MRLGRNISSESTGRAIIQRLRPTAQKYGLRRAIVETYLREHLSPEFRNATWDELKGAPSYADIRKAAEYRAPSFTPDLSEVYPEDREIIIFEIQDRCPVSRTKLKKMRSWVARLDGWDAWSMILITTNGLGLGWDVLIDTLGEGRRYAIASFREDPRGWLQTYPDLATEADINRSYSWRNWHFPSNEEFEELKSTMSFL